MEPWTGERGDSANLSKWGLWPRGPTCYGVYILATDGSHVNLGTELSTGVYSQKLGNWELKSQLGQELSAKRAELRSKTKLTPSPWK